MYEISRRSAIPLFHEGKKKTCSDYALEFKLLLSSKFSMDQEQSMLKDPFKRCELEPSMYQQD